MTITINRPSVRNAPSSDVFAGLISAFGQLDSDPGLRAGILTGAGGYFSAGMDLAGIVAGAGLDLTVMRDGRPHKPVITAIEGYSESPSCRDE